WNHTWSLAVEEHFYLVLPLLLLGLARMKPGAANPFRPLPWLCVFVAGGLLGLRLYVAACFDFNVYTHLFPTHLRLDSLLVGVLLSYLHHFAPDYFARLVAYRGWLLLAGALLLTPAFVLPLESTPFIYTAGLTLFALGSACLVVGCTDLRSSL